MILLVLLAQPSNDGGANVALDDERLQEDIPKGLQKVELDLDDALFLEFEENEEQPPPEPEPEQQPETDVTVPVPVESKSKKTRKKFLIFGAIAGLCLLLGAGGSYFFLKSWLNKPQEQAVHEQPAEEAKGHEAKPAHENASAEGQEEKAKAPTLSPYAFEPFQAEYVLNDQIRFLTCRFSVQNATDIMRLEMQAKSIFIRDGVYRYFKSSSLSFLDNPANSEKLKTDLAAVINQYMKSGQVSEILLDEYVVR